MTSPTLREQLAVYFDTNGFGPDGGYDAAWVDFKLGPVPFPFPNTPARRRAVRYHDLHHIVTGYRTDLAGEFEISAWEIGSGCKDFVAAWQLNLGGLAGGLLCWPRRTFRAFVEGRRSENFYGRPYDASLLETPVDEARQNLGITRARGASASVSDYVLFVLTGLAGLIIGLSTFALFAPLALLAAPVLHLLARGHRGRLPHTG
jgi:hypothetical protein